MKITKLQSGSYRVQKQINGKRISMTWTHKPTKAEIEKEIANRLGFYNGKLTFKAALESYINARTNILSPSTIKGYKQIVNSISERFMYRTLDDITNNEIQLEVNSYAASVSPKTVKNRYTLISSVFREFKPGMILRVNLPMQIRKEPYIPTSEEVQRVIAAADGTQYKTALLLACCGLRRGEICALTMQDIDFDNSIVDVNKDIVQDDSGKWIIKPPKTPTSIRKVHVPESVLESIKQNGLYQKNPNNITHWLHQKQDLLGIPRFSLHKLRHYFVSAAHDKGISDAAIMQVGGWSNPNVMIKHYRHAKNTESVTENVLKDII